MPGNWFETITKVIRLLIYILLGVLCSDRIYNAAGCVYILLFWLFGIKLFIVTPYYLL